jgi:hypothetical protein
MTKLALKLLFLTLICSGCKFNDQKSDDKIADEFEGIITYKLGYENFRDSDFYGDTLKVFYSHGKFSNMYNTKKSNGLKSYVYLPAENYEYMKFNNSDTLLWFNVADNSKMKLLNVTETNASKKILGYACKTLNIVSHYHDKDISFFQYERYIYSPSLLHFDKNKFKDFNFNFLNLSLNKAGGAYFLYYESYIPRVGKRTFEALKIERKKLDPEVFQVDRTKLREFKF